MRTGAGSSWPNLLARTVVTVTVGLAVASCTDNRPADKATPSATSSSAARSSMTFEEAYRRVPMNGTNDLPITWDLAGAPHTDEILAARRGLAFSYWLGQATDWAPLIPIGRFIYTEEHYEKFLAPFAKSSSNDNPLIGPIWVKVMGVEQNGPDQSTVTFCTDLGYWHNAEAKDRAQVRKERANLESYVMKNVKSGDGEQHWRVDRQIDKDGSRKARYGGQCTEWAQHKR
ncbi:hypothetical protein AB0J80_23950 [Actinoplanes sp. NPDC049548]|uniref:hypothetical protein n=1 Tax=Actinoplanes sp. NPDC049548 TaxID=3155152 RepID=UPI00341C6B59